MVNHEKPQNKIIQFWQRNIVRILFAVSLIFSVVYRTILINIEEAFPFAFELGEITYYTALAVFASCIFYYFIVHLKEKSDKRKIKQLVNMRLEQIEMMKGIIFKDIISQSQVQDKKQEFPKSIEDLKEILKGMKLTARPPRYFAGSQLVEVKDWYTYFEYNFHYDKHNIEILQKHITFLNSETVQMLHDLSSCMFITAIHQYDREKGTNDYADKFENLAGPLYDYLTKLGNFKKDCWL
ncbi:hypothetical protein SAMN05661096_03575 [Marivirga sericea]|uniref:Uncharacterized protein n=1 Tax=Marivirga sericea TaxID=1028 RepID=A0A1X7L7L3_9BACT|nr:hypothetical protein [Marivirga sericea]SMG49169.1 hypothetical protein SAMN05661096_03575 [Marivirga sericea]